MTQSSNIHLGAEEGEKMRRLTSCVVLMMLFLIPIGLTGCGGR